MDYIDKRLPHKYPVRFIKEVIEEGENHAVSLVAFKETPTLAAIVEAAAQNVVFIQSMYREFDGGVLTVMKNIVLMKVLSLGDYRVESRVAARLDQFCTIKFELLDEECIVVQGEMSIVMKERE